MSGSTCPIYASDKNLENVKRISNYINTLAHEALMLVNKCVYFF